MQTGWAKRDVTLETAYRGMAVIMLLYDVVECMIHSHRPREPHMNPRRHLEWNGIEGRGSFHSSS
jgi:hypothetical protein